MASLSTRSPPPTPGLPANTGDIMTGAMIFSLVAGQAIGFAWMLAKVALYAWGRRVIASEATQDWILSKT